MRDSALKPAPTARRRPSCGHVGEELMRDSALKLVNGLAPACAKAAHNVGEELMRDSALKPSHTRPTPLWQRCRVGEELMRDSALKPFTAGAATAATGGRRRAHARQRFET